MKEQQQGYLKIPVLVSKDRMNALVMILETWKLKAFSCSIGLLGDITSSVCGIEFTELNANEDQTSTALRYICHFMVIASKYLQITLRYSPCYKVSRSLIRNPLIRSDSDFGWPLHRKETERRHYEQAVNYLTSDVKQVFCALGHTYVENIPLLENLQHMLKKVSCH